MTIYEKTLEQVTASLKKHSFRKPLPSFGERDTWERLRGRLRVQQVLTDCAAVVHEPIPQLLATDYLEFRRTGVRKHFDAKFHQRRRNLARLTVAYCVEAEPRYLDAVTDYLWSICEESTWVQSAHLEKVGSSTVLPSARIHQIDLGAAMTGLLLTETAGILRECLPPELSVRVREEVLERIVTPYYYRNNLHWMFNTGNWNSVCHAGILGSAIYLVDDPVYLGSLIVKTVEHLRNYIRYFDEDGGTPEGIHCWSLGFSHYTILSDLLERRSGGELSLLTGDEKAVRIARFGWNISLCGHQYVNFSDNVYENFLTPFIAEYANRSFDAGIPVLRHKEFRIMTCFYRDVLSHEETHIDRYPDRPLNFLSKGIQWMVSRADRSDEDALILACKGGHNGEEHNHNDGGAFLIHYRQEALIGELGKETFNRDMFSRNRYNFLATSSEGHSVPVLNGRLQGFGKEYTARILEYDSNPEADRICFDLAGMYPAEAGVGRFLRSFRFDRRSGHRIEVTDLIDFTDSGEYRGVFWTAWKPEVSADRVVIHGNRGVLTISGFSEILEVSAEPVPAAVRGEDWYKIVFAAAIETEVRLPFLFTVE